MRHCRDHVHDKEDSPHSSCRTMWRLLRENMCLGVEERAGVMVPWEEMKKEQVLQAVASQGCGNQGREWMAGQGEKSCLQVHLPLQASTKQCPGVSSVHKLSR